GAFKYPLAINDLRLCRAVHLGLDGKKRIRIAALRADDERTDVHLFAEDDGFAAPCITASFCPARIEGTQPTTFRAVALFSGRPLYGPLFFSVGRFRRLESFEKANSRRLVARFRPQGPTRWFGTYEANKLVLWDPSAADAALHALQVT